MARRALLATLFFLLILGSASVYATCPSATRQIYLAAVTGESSGGVFQLTVETRPGNGTIYTAVNPRTGFATQESEEIAVDYAFANSNYRRSECDIFFKISGTDDKTTVDGPSAGAAMTVATHAAITGKQVRQDIVMTGTISSAGNVGEVGGIIEKAIAAADSGARYFLTPKLQVHEALLISSISKGGNFQAIETLSIPEAEKIAFSEYSKEFGANYTPKSRPLPENLEEQKLDAEMARFSLVAGRVVGKLETKVDSVFGDNGNLPQILGLREYFRNEIAKEKQQISLGYPFTAANAAFLLSIDAEYVRIGNRGLDMTGSRADVSSCIGKLQKIPKTGENFQWALGADLRRNWAQKKLNDTYDLDSGQDDYSRLRDLLFAYSWCGISEELSSQASEIGGKPIVESALSSLAAKKISDADSEIANAARPDIDAFWHLETAKQAEKNGDFAAAIYDATYARVMQQVSGENVQNVSEAAKKMMAEGRKSLWGKIYYSQGSYLYQEAVSQKFPPLDAYRILRYSQELDNVAGEIEAELAKGNAAPARNGNGGGAAGKTQQKGEHDLAVSALLAACVGGLSILAAYRAMKTDSARRA
ncbi:MAG: S16 family serine protease [Candidatus Anstonellaceae archaeon]